MEGSEPFQTLSDLRDRASHQIPPDIWGWLEGGAGEGSAIRNNERAFATKGIIPRVFVDVSKVDTGTRFLGVDSGCPFYVNPVGGQGLIHHDGELATARAASSRGVLAVFSTISTYSIEEIAGSAPGGHRWFQLYIQDDERRTASLIDRAEEARCSAIVVTADSPVVGVRDRQHLSGFSLDGLKFGNLDNPPIGISKPAISPFAAFSIPSATWETFDWVRSVTRLPVLVKGILSAEDARMATEHGAKGIVVSNHGGRQLDGAVGSLDALPSVIQGAGPELEVYMDGGVRRGKDIFVALALGARGVGIGRPVMWALGLGGEDGVKRLLDLVKRELTNTMALAGCTRVSEIGPSQVYPQPENHA